MQSSVSSCKEFPNTFNTKSILIEDALNLNSSLVCTKLVRDYSQSRQTSSCTMFLRKVCKTLRLHVAFLVANTKLQTWCFSLHLQMHPTNAASLVFPHIGHGALAQSSVNPHRTGCDRTYKEFTLRHQEAE
ncbi:hypothetical protein XENORESO_014889 [Xenotaenia resolanae]|uniref:Uncharacterized protein n=1 Tax=Xenotaenia resolanae TaxID=208358 RepID=A0ABV0VSZ2_9TELE